MKKILLTMIGLAAGATLAHAQGVQFYSSSAGAQTSASNLVYSTGSGETPNATPNGTKTPTGTTAPFAYDFVLLIATSTNGGDELNPLGSDWSLITLATGGSAMATNGVPTTGTVGGPGGSSGFTSDLTAGTTYYDMVVGWSASLGTWEQVEALLTSNFSGNSIAGFFGVSTVGLLTPTASPAPNAQVFAGAGIPNNSTVMYAVPVPEPTTLALAGLGGLSLLMFRRRKNS